MNQSYNYKGICRTAMTTPGLLKKVNNGVFKTKYHSSYLQPSNIVYSQYIVHYNTVYCFFSFIIPNLQFIAHVEKLTCNQQNISDDYISSMHAIKAFIVCAQDKTFQHSTHFI